MSREGLPKGWRYPLSTVELRDALGELPADKVIRTHLRRHLLRTEEYRAILKAGDAIPTLAGCFNNWSGWREPASRSRREADFPPIWDVELYGVPEEWRETCHDALLREGVAVVRAWLIEPRSSFWLEKPPGPPFRRECSVLVRPRDGVLNVVERG